jgi:WXG100 family type VII secretion target
MATTAAELAQMAAVAKKFEDNAGTMSGLLNDLMMKLEITKDAWQGRSGRSFDEVKLTFERNQKALLSALTETSAAIKKASTTLGSSDEDAASSIARVAQGGPNLNL